MTAQDALLIELLDGLDPFGDDPEPERLRQPDHGPDDGAVLLVEAQSLHEAAVDLHHVDREPT